jgi:hypothetical protein
MVKNIAFMATTLPQNQRLTLRNPAEQPSVGCAAVNQLLSLL